MATVQMRVVHENLPSIPPLDCFGCHIIALWLDPLSGEDVLTIDAPTAPPGTRTMSPTATRGADGLMVFDPGWRS